MSALAAPPVIRIDKSKPPPDWALAERALLEAYTDAAGEFAAKYVDMRGFFRFERWGGNDGPDDVMETFPTPWTLLYALGAPDSILDLYRKGVGRPPGPVHTGQGSVDPNGQRRNVLQGVCHLIRLGAHRRGSGSLPFLRIGRAERPAIVRYFDPGRRRAGLPEDVAALVEKILADSVVLTIVNTSPVHARNVVVQTGAFAEHQALSIEAGGRKVPVDASHFTVRLAAGAGETITIAMKRYANQPTAVFPWDR